MQRISQVQYRKKPQKAVETWQGKVYQNCLVRGTVIEKTSGEGNIRRDDYPLERIRGGVCPP
tara:strand:- start:1990 stop:2175 length:186 start_codon:yes stop_codon:yes gene_type:complete